MRRSDLLWRAALVVAALLAVPLSAPQAVAGGLALAALVAAGERLVRLRAHGALDRLLVLVGGLLVALVLTGMVLGTTVGLRPATWVVALAVVAGAGLVVALLAPRPARVATPDARRHGLVAVRTLPWIAACVVVGVVAVGISVRSLTAVDTQPLQMAFGTVSGTDVQVVVSAGDQVGPLEVRASQAGNDVSYPLFSVADDGTRTTTLSLPKHGRYVITLNYPDQTQPLRTLILDR